MSSLLHKRRPLDIWPAFVDATASLLMVVVFMLMIASIGQLFLTREISGRDTALSQLNKRVAALADELSMQSSESLRLGQLLKVRNANLNLARGDLAKSETLVGQKSDKLERQSELLRVQSQVRLVLENDVTALTVLRDSLSAELQSSVKEGNDVRRRAAVAEEANLAAQAQTALLNRQLGELSKQIASLSHALEITEADSELKQTTIDDLGKRLNIALVSKAEALKRYRSEFFGRLREALADYPGILVVGDRFVLPSELLFESASAELDKDGREQVARLATALKELGQRIPDDLEWVLRVDGHTDSRAIHSDQFASNWELSAARAIRIVRALVDLDIPASRLAATGFAEHHPLDTSATAAGHARNRRIEIMLTSR
jgi:chemotaxis protein MotB